MDFFREGVKELIVRSMGEVKIAEAENTREVIEQVTDQEWDVVILDIDLPGRSGLDALQELKRIRPKVPVLVISGLPESEYAIRALKSGASGYISKVAAIDELAVALKKVLAGGRYVSEATAELLAANLNPDSRRSVHEGLSNREFQVMRRIAIGKTTKEIAAELSLSEKTVATYRARIMEKTGLKSSVEITRYALQNNLVS